MHGIRDYIQACYDRKKFLSNQRKWLADEYAQFNSDARQLEAVLDRVRQELIGYLVPEVQDSFLAELETRIAYPGLLPIKREYDARFREAEQRRIQLESMDEIQFYDLQHEQASQALEEVTPAYESIRLQESVWEASKSFQRLKRRGYFEEDYRPGIWVRFLNWRDISFLMSYLQKRSGVDDATPEIVRSKYRSLRAEADDIGAAYDARDAELRRITSLKKEYESLLSAPERLLSELYRDLGKAVLAHLSSCTEELRLELAREDRNLTVFLKKEMGIQKQIQYLRELRVTRVDARIQQVDQDLAKLESKLKRLDRQRRRGKRKHYTAAELNRTRAFNTAKWEKRRQQTEKLRTRISGFDHHERGSILTDFLWWDLITKEARGDDLFEVREFHERHPGWSYRTYQDPVAPPIIPGTAGQDAIDAAADSLAADMTNPRDELWMEAS